MVEVETEPEEIEEDLEDVGEEEGKVAGAERGNLQSSSTVW